MEEKNVEKGKNIIIGILIGVIICLVIVLLFVSYNKFIVKDKNKNNNATIKSDDIDISLSINNVTVSKDAPNEKIHMDGTINLSYDSGKYAGVELFGYCLGLEDEKYLIHGPSDGRIFFHNDGNNKLTLSEDITDIKYPNGTVKQWSWLESDWDNVKIKYCKIDKMKAFLNDQINYHEFALNIEKKFN